MLLSTEVILRQAERERIKRETEAFLARGGKIKQADTQAGNRDGLTITRHRENTHLFGERILR